MFQRIKAEDSGVHFVNTITETDSFNILEDEFMYNGGGIGLGDFNQDGRLDLYFAGNQVGNKLYLNEGNFQFRDVTEESGTRSEDIWSSGITVVDINGDQKLDIYVSATHDKTPDRRTNKMFVNQGNDPEGVPVFKDLAAQYGLADTSHTTHSVFFDYDLDGDLDLFMLLDEMLLKRSSTIEPKKVDGSSKTTDKLFRNDNGQYTDVSQEAGILIEGFGLGVAVLDVNQDAYPDLYISNDFITNDVLYINNGDGTFSDRINEFVRHQSYSSMGNDVADINNDGLLDIMTLDMLPNTNRRVKQMMNQTRYLFYDLMAKRGYAMQYVRNCLQVNRGVGFSEVSQMAGVAATDWSWSVLLADYDNDGHRDMFISNGFPRDVTDMDFGNFRTDIKGRFSATEIVLAEIPRVKIRNFLYRNLGLLQFEDVSEAWGLELPSYSNGAAYGDLDNDGDLDLVVNNINDHAFIYRNQATTIHTDHHFIRLQLKGPPANPQGLGAKISIEYGEKNTAYAEYQPYRGYIASMEPYVHFGLGKAESIEKISIVWPDGRISEIRNSPIDQTLVVDHRASKSSVPQNKRASTPIFRSAENMIDSVDQHRELDFQDFRIQPLLPRQHSKEGPGLAVGDLNGDGLEDFFLANGKDHPGFIYTQQSGGVFQGSSLPDTSSAEDLGVLLFDADNDDDLDLYIASGSSEFRAYDPAFQDRLFINNGEGAFQRAPSALPDIHISSSTVNAADFDRDGDLDLFVGGRLIPQSYPLPEKSLLLRNNEGRFHVIEDQSIAPFNQLGMVTSALWTDFDNDDWVDLIVVGEWMPIQFYRNTKGKLKKIDPSITDAVTSRNVATSGWWNSINSGDFDRDGDSDYIIGNQGLNNQYRASSSHPLRIHAKDFDENGGVDHVISAFREGNYYPVHLKNDFIRQLNGKRRTYLKYADYAQATTQEIFTEEEWSGVYTQQATILESIYLENRGNNRFEVHVLPQSVQYAPAYGSTVGDFNGDGQLDVLLIGNRFGSETFTGRHDASLGSLLLGDGRGHFQPVSPLESGFLVKGDARSIIQLRAASDQQFVIVGQSNGPLKVFGQPSTGKTMEVTPHPLEYKVKIEYRDGSEEVREIHYGSGYLSQPSRSIYLQSGMLKKLTLINYDGEERIIEIGRLSEAF